MPTETTPFTSTRDRLHDWGYEFAQREADDREARQAWTPAPLIQATPDVWGVR